MGSFKYLNSVTGPLPIGVLLCSNQKPLMWGILPIFFAFHLHMGLMCAAALWIMAADWFFLNDAATSLVGKLCNIQCSVDIWCPEWAVFPACRAVLMFLLIWVSGLCG